MSYGDILLGNEVTEEIVNVSTLFNASDNQYDVAVRGFVYPGDIRGPFGKNQNYLHKGKIFDGESSMFYSFWHPLKVNMKQGDTIIIGGSTKKDKYTRGEYELVADNIQKWNVELKEKHDDAEKKRVEFQNMTFFTDHRGTMGADKLVKRAHKYGMPAVAITDVGVVQGFPKAYEASKETGQKVIYGMTANVIDFDPVIFDPTPKSIKDARYIVFDVETTGLSAYYDHLIEIGAAVFTMKPVCDTCGHIQDDTGVCESCRGLGKKKTSDDESLRTVRYQLVKGEEFNKLIHSPKPVSPFIEDLTGISQTMLDEQGVSLEDAMKEFKSFIGDNSILVAHNAQFDKGMIDQGFKRVGLESPEYSLIDSLQLSRIVNTEYKAHGLAALVKKEKVNLESHHRATDDAIATGHVFSRMLERAMDNYDCFTISDLGDLLMEEHYRFIRPNEVSIWAKTQKGLKNLYKIVSRSHTDYLTTAGASKPGDKYPVVPWSLIEKHKEDLVLGSGSHLGEVFQSALEKDEETLKKSISRYDVIELQPESVSNHLWNHPRPKTDDPNNIIDSWTRIHEEAKRQNKFIITTGHAHYLDEKDAIYHNILLYSNATPSMLTEKHHERRPGRLDHPQGPAHLRTTDEMINSFSYLSEDESYRYSVENTVAFADQFEEVHPVPNELYMPDIPGVNDDFRNLTYENTKKVYGDPIPQKIQDRLDKELESIIGNGYAGLYMVSRDLVKKSIEDGYLVGSRGSVGSSYAATASEITEVNPLDPHYICKNDACKWSMFFEHKDILSGFDLPYSFKSFFDREMFSEEARGYVIERFKEEFDTDEDKILTAMTRHEDHECPKCKEKTLKGDGQGIPFEIFLGFKGDKVPDIDLNFSGVYQPKAHQYIIDKFGYDKVYRAGTITTIAEKTSYASVKTFMENHGKHVSRAEIDRLSDNLLGAKNSTGRHPGGMLVVKEGMEMEDFSPYQYPSNSKYDKTGEINHPTSHFDFNSIHDFLPKFDILGHEMPTNLRYMKDLTGVDPRDIPDADPKVLKLFHDTEGALGVSSDEFLAETGTLGLPEMNSRVPQQAIKETKPKKYGDLLILSGLTHGEDVFFGNAQDLINDGVASIDEVIGCRDDIMRTLIFHGIENSMAFQIMEAVRKGKPVKDEWEKAMKDAGVPEWYIDSAKKIKYLFPRAHAAAYVTDAIRMGYFKVYYPLEFYTAQMTARFNEEDVLEMQNDIPTIKRRIGEIDEEMKQLKSIGEHNKSKNIESLRKALNLLLEGKVRGVEVGEVDLYKSHATEFRMDKANNTMIPPFSTIDGVGETAAKRFFEEAQKDIFYGLEDFVSRTGANKTHVSKLRDMGCLDSIELRQYVFF